MRLLKQLFWLFLTLGVLFGVLELFMYDVIKIDWPSFMEIQVSYRPMEDPLPVPGRSIPIEGAAYIPYMGAPENPTTAGDEASLTRGAELYAINCKMCHGPEGKGNGSVSAFLANKPANFTTEVVQSKSDGSFFMTITNGVDGRMPALNENLTVSERWDVVNFLRTFKLAK